MRKSLLKGLLQQKKPDYRLFSTKDPERKSEEKRYQKL
jgi:hypothetical protein